MEIQDTYKLTINDTLFYVYECLIDNIPTKYLTRSEFNFKMKVKYENEELKYYDENNKDILIYDINDIEYFKIHKPITIN